MLIGRNRGYFFLIFLSPRAKLLTPDLSSGENTCSCLAEHIAEHAISSFCWFLQFVPRQQRLLSSSLEFGVLPKFVPKILGNQLLQLQRKLLKLNFRFLLEAARDYLSHKLKT